jgi:hypothetical protein
MQSLSTMYPCLREMHVTEDVNQKYHSLNKVSEFERLFPGLRVLSVNAKFSMYIASRNLEELTVHCSLMTIGSDEPCSLKRLRLVKGAMLVDRAVNSVRHENLRHIYVGEDAVVSGLFVAGCPNLREIEMDRAPDNESTAHDVASACRAGGWEALSADVAMPPGKKWPVNAKILYLSDRAEVTIRAGPFVCSSRFAKRFDRGQQ